MEVKEEELTKVTGGTESNTKCPKGAYSCTERDCKGCAHLLTDSSSNINTHTCGYGVKGQWSEPKRNVIER